MRNLYVIAVPQHSAERHTAHRIEQNSSAYYCVIYQWHFACHVETNIFTLSRVLTTRTHHSSQSIVCVIVMHVIVIIFIENA